LKRSLRKFCDGLPIDLVQIETNPNPTLLPNISRNEKRFRIAHDQPALLAKVGRAGERDHTVAVMIEEVICECFLANAKGDMLVAYRLIRDLRQTRTNLNQSRQTAF